MAFIIASADKALDRSIDVETNVTKDQVERVTDLSVAVFSTPDAPFDQGADRIKLYATFDELKVDFNSTQEAYRAGNIYFAQSPRAKNMAVGKIFEAAMSGYMKGKGYNTVIGDWQAVSDGEFNIIVDGTPFDIVAIDTSGAADIPAVIVLIQARLDFASAGVTVSIDGGSFRFTSNTTGDTSTVSDLATLAAPTGTDISGAGFINAANDPQDDTDDNVIVDGYTPTGNIQDELQLISDAASATGKFVYAYALDRKFRDSSDQIDAATWMEARRGILALTLNSPLVLDPNSTSDIGFLLEASANIRTFSNFHDNAFYYPEMGILARMLSVNYSAERSTITAKFKDIVGIPTVGIDSTDLTVLNNKRVNTFTAVGNNARTVREGIEANTNWFIDDLINLDNYEEQIQTEVYNVFLKNGKVPYNTDGTTLLRSAIERISTRFIFNGTFSDREVLDETGDLNSPLIEAAFTITNTPFSLMTASERASRVGPPFIVRVNLAGAIHSVVININAFS